MQHLHNDNAFYESITYDLNFRNSYCKNTVQDFKPEIFSRFGLTQLIDIPTKITQDTMSLIDLFSMNNIKNINCHRSLTRIADQDGAVLN